MYNLKFWIGRIECYEPWRIWYIKSSIFKLLTTKYKIYNNIYIYIYIHNLGYVEVLSEKEINKQTMKCNYSEGGGVKDDSEVEKCVKWFSIGWPLTACSQRSGSKHCQSVSLPLSCTIMYQVFISFELLDRQWKWIRSRDTSRFLLKNSNVFLQVLIPNTESTVRCFCWNRRRFYGSRMPPALKWVAQLTAHRPLTSHGFTMTALL